MKALTGQDAFFIYTETPEQHQHTVGVLILDPSTAPKGRFSIDNLIEKMSRDIDLLPEFRQKLSTIPLALAPPTLVDDPQFNFSDHIETAALAKPGSMEQLATLVSEIASEPLDKNKPLWQTWFISGLENGRIAVASKSHHCISDGVQGAEFMAQQFEFSPDAPEPKTADTAQLDWQPEKANACDIAFTGWQNQLKDRQGVKSMFDKTLRAINNRKALFEDRNEAASLVPSLLPSAPKLAFNGAISARRKIAFGQLPLADVKAIKNHFGVKINDVVLCAVALSLRDILISQNDLPTEPLVIAIPVSLELQGQERGNKGNANGNMMVKVPVHIADAKECLDFIHASTIEAKTVFEHSFEDLMNGYLSLLPPVVANRAMKSLFSKTAANIISSPTNLTVSNFPGPPIPLYMLGAKLEATFPVGPVINMQGLMTTFMSSMDSIDFSCNACADKFPQVQALRDGIVDSVQQLKTLIN